MNTRFLRTILSGLLLLQAASSVCADDELSPRLSRTNLLSYRNASGEVVPIKSVADWSKRRAAILVGMQRVMGPLPGSEKRCPLDPQITEEVNCGDYVRRLISYASEPGSRVPAYLLIPKRALSGSGKFPAVLALHQTHEAGQKVVVGLGESPNDEYGVALAKRGFVVLAPPYTMLANYWPDVKALGYQSGTMKAIWDNLRGLDYLSTLPFVKTNGLWSRPFRHHRPFARRPQRCLHCRVRRANQSRRIELRPGFIPRLRRRRSKSLEGRARLVSAALHAEAAGLRRATGIHPV